LKTKKYHTVRTVLKYNRKIVERGKIDTINTQIHDRSLSWPSTGTSIERFLGSLEVNSWIIVIEKYI